MNASMSADDLQRAPAVRRHDPIAQWFLAPFHARSFTNLIYLLLSLPMGLVYFTFLATGLTAGTGLLITLLGMPIVALTFWGSWWLSVLERHLAVGLLGAEVPPMGPGPIQSGQGFRQNVEQFLGNRVTWTGLLFLVLKLPLGIFSFVTAVTLVAVSCSFLLVPFLYPLSFIEWDGMLLWWVDSPAEAVLCFVVGLLFTYVSLLVLNGLAAVWKALAVATLGSARYSAPAVAEETQPEEISPA